MKYALTHPGRNHPAQGLQIPRKEVQLPPRVPSHQTDVHPRLGTQPLTQNGDKPDLLATAGECLKIWRINDNKDVSLEVNLKNVLIP